MDRQTNKNQTNEKDRTMSLSSLNSIRQAVFKLESGNKNVDGQTDGETDR